MSTNIPDESQPDSSTEVKKFFNRFFDEPLTFPVSQIDAVIGFFIKRGFSETSAKSTSIVLLSQAKQDGINVFKLLDSLKGLTNIQLSEIVTQVLNSSRESISILGYRVLNTEETTESRNIRP